ncbi:transporter substrate-binding domain-containing protein [Phytoactinopolyspora halotolerans]|uniref:Transporter substrate-binding domain-containing protein n=2 Tax=Phytoactinopolyspora halotolerans TaxID=1981512 RepID=A0A6L9SBP3_9ACTN|nr:transporter substrate-binding domain-containing protein [Phytoactinopolyspora halotolerans]
MRRAILGAAAAGLLLLSACGDDDEPTTTSNGEDTPAADGEGAPASEDLELVSDGTLTVCSDVPYPPFEIEDSDAPSGYSGFDIDIVQAIADGLGLELVVQDVGFDALQSGTVLAAGQCDLGASAMTITEERKENLDFSDPYYDSLQSLLVPVDSDIDSLDDLAGQALGVQQGTTGKAYAEENAPEDTEITDFPSDGELWPALQAGTIAGILQDFPVNDEHATADEGYHIVETYETDEQYGFAFPKDEKPALLAAVNEQLQELRDNGTYDEIYNTYFSTDS